MFCLEISYVHGLSLFSEVSVNFLDFLKDSDGHVTDTVPWHVEVFTSSLVNMFVLDIATVLTKPLMKGFVGLSNVLLSALFTLNQIDNISCVAIVMLMELHFVIPCC